MYNLLQRMVQQLPELDFESRKSVVSIFNTIIRRRIGQRTPTVEYICAGHQDILITLLTCYKNEAVALNYGMMLRECLRHESLAEVFLQSEQILDLFDYVQVPTFDLASDAFATLKDLFSKHPMLSATYLLRRYDEFIPRFNLLLQSDNYVTRRQSLKLIGELLLERSNYDVMTRYVDSGENLKLMMNLLRDSSRNIQFEAFHVFKIFVANPNKQKSVHDILLKNQQKLLDFLESFLPTKNDDQRFLEEREFIMQQIAALDSDNVSIH